MEDLAKSVERLKKSITSSKRMPDSNVKSLEEHVAFMQARGLNVRTVVKHLDALRWFFRFLGDVDARKASKQEIERVMAKVESSGLGFESKRKIRVVVKAFYKHLLGEDAYYPKQVAWIKTSQRMKQVLPEDILTEAEVLRMIEASGHVRDKAIIALLFDSGMRIGELLSLRVKDVDLESEPAHVIVSGKTGMRRIPILFSAPYIASYLETIKGRKPTDQLLKPIGTWSNLDRRIDRSAVAKVLMLAAQKARVNKKVNPHAFRHARATYYANRLTEQQLKVLFGWTGDSRMVSTYVHMSGRDIDDAVLQAYGRKPKEELEPKLTVKVCPRCRYENGMDFLHCQRCGAPLDVGTVMRETKATESTKEAMLEMLKDPEFQKDMLKYLEKRRKEER